MESTGSLLTIKNTIDGIWVNNDKNRKEAVKVIISNNGKKVQVLGKANSKGCNWGTKNLTPETNSMNSYWAIFDTSFAKSIFIFTINNNKMEVRYEQNYKLPSSETVNYIENFTKQNLHVNQSIATPTSVRIKRSSIAQWEDISVQESNMLWGGLDTYHDFESPSEIMNVKADMYSVESPIPHNKDKGHSLKKWILNSKVVIRGTINRIRNTVSVRKLMLLTDTIV